MDHIEGELHSNALAVSENSETSIGRMLQELCVTLDPNVDGFFLEKSQFLTTPPPPLPLVLGFLIANFEYDRPHPLRFFSKKTIHIGVKCHPWIGLKNNVFNGCWTIGDYHLLFTGTIDANADPQNHSINGNSSTIKSVHLLFTG